MIIRLFWCISAFRISFFEDSVDAWIQIACPILSIDWEAIVDAFWGGDCAWGFGWLVENSLVGKVTDLVVGVTMECKGYGGRLWWGVFHGLLCSGWWGMEFFLCEESNPLCTEKCCVFYWHCCCYITSLGHEIVN